jgi:hypothetical protein
MEKQHLIGHKIRLFAALIGNNGMSRRPSIALAARVAEEGCSLLDSMRSISAMIEKPTQICQVCAKVKCGCETYLSDASIASGIMAYLSHMVLPMEYSWYRHVIETSEQWLSDQVPNNTWKLVSEFDVQGNLLHRKKLQWDIGSIHPMNRIDVDQFMDRLREMIPHGMLVGDQQQLRKTLEEINVNIANGWYWNAFNEEEFNLKRDCAIYAEMMLENDLGLSMEEVEQRLLKFAEHSKNLLVNKKKSQSQQRRPHSMREDTSSSSGYSSNDGIDDRLAHDSRTSPDSSPASRSLSFMKEEVRRIGRGSCMQFSKELHARGNVDQRWNKKTQSELGNLMPTQRRSIYSYNNLGNDGLPKNSGKDSFYSPSSDPEVQKAAVQATSGKLGLKPSALKTVTLEDSPISDIPEPLSSAIREEAVQHRKTPQHWDEYSSPEDQQLSKASAAADLDIPDPLSEQPDDEMSPQKRHRGLSKLAVISDSSASSAVSSPRKGKRKMGMN